MASMPDGRLAPTMVTHRMAPSTATMIGKAVHGLVSRRSSCCCQARRREPPLRVMLRPAMRAASP